MTRRVQSQDEYKIRGTFDNLDAWGQRLRVPYRPDHGSELAADDLDWPVFPTSQVAVSGMGAARDHLQAVRVHLDRGVLEVFPFAQGALIRTAMLSAAQAVWVLSPTSRGDRLKNARTLAHHTYEQHLLYLRDLQALAPKPHANTDDVAAHVAQRLSELTTLRTSEGQKAKFEATKAIYDAALATWNRPDFALEAKVEWRRGSGAAHGLVWSVLGRRETRQASDVDGLGIAAFEAGGSIEGLANPYLCAHGLLAHAFTLLGQRGTAPT